MVGGRILRDRSVLLNKSFFDIPAGQMAMETMEDALVGRVSLLFPQGNTTELLVKYGECQDSRSYVPVADVLPADMDILHEVGRLQWKSATRTKEIIVVEFTAEEE
jgi:hypothetical protein